jgi:predicted NAD/FAD-dependent oxidoreductase
VKLAIIGAGMAGLAAARKIQQLRPELEITVYEKSRGYGGRVATRRRDGFVFDHGAQNIKPSPEVEQFMLHNLPTDQLRDVTLPIWTFDAANTISAGEDEYNREHKWIYGDGLNRLGKLLGEGVDVRRAQRVASLRRRANDEGRTSSFVVRRSSETYQLFDTDNQAVDEADMVLLTPPAPQTSAIVADSGLPDGVKEALTGELEKAAYTRCLSFALPYHRQIERPFYALINTDRKHAIAWLALEHAKGPERCPADSSLLIAQMAPQWSLDHWDVPVEELAPQVTELVSALLGEDMCDPLWCDRQGWRYAQPTSVADFGVLNRVGAEHGLFFAGDYTAGKGRVHLAIESGWRAADLIAHHE